MSYWEQDPYVPEGDYDTRPNKGGRSYLTEKAISSMIAIGRNEGVRVIGFDHIDTCINTGATTYQYDPRRPEIVVCLSQPWPQARWSLAVALGHHFTRHHFYRLSDRAVWRQQAEQWALSFLAAQTAEQSRYPDLLPDNTIYRPVRPRVEEAPEPPRPVSNYKFPKNACKGTTGEGKPCRISRVEGSLFCRHHQDQQAEVKTLADIVGELRGRSHE